MKHFLHAIVTSLEGLAGLAIIGIFIYGCSQSSDGCHMGG